MTRRRTTSPTRSSGPVVRPASSTSGVSSSATMPAARWPACGLPSRSSSSTPLASTPGRLARWGDRRGREIEQLEHLLTRTPELPRVEFDVSQVACAVVEAAQVLGEEAELHAAPTLACCRPGDLAVALKNVLDNARHHAPGSPVRVGVDSDADGVRITCSDLGQGVSADGAAGIFDRGYPGAASTGTGSPRQRPGADAGAGRRPQLPARDRGATFVLRPPAAAAGAVPRRPPSGRCVDHEAAGARGMTALFEAPGEASSPSSGGSHVLLIDDHRLLSQALAMALNAQGLVADVPIISDRATLLAQVADAQPELVLLDLELGGSARPRLAACARPGGLPGAGRVRQPRAPSRCVRALDLGAGGVVSRDCPSPISCRLCLPQSPAGRDASVPKGAAPSALRGPASGADGSSCPVPAPVVLRAAGSARARGRSQPWRRSGRERFVSEASRAQPRCARRTRRAPGCLPARGGRDGPACRLALIRRGASSELVAAATGTYDVPRKVIRTGCHSSEGV